MKRLAMLCAMLLAGGAAHAADLPGQKFLLRSSDLPKPYATPSATNNDKQIARPAGVMPRAPKGFTVSIFADHLDNPRGLLVAPNGDVFLSERTEGKITLLRDAGGRVGQRFTFLSGYIKPQGMAIKDGWFYFSDQQAVWRVPYKPGAATAGKPQRVTVAPDLRNSGMHATRSLAVAPDGTVFVEIGSFENVSDYKPGAQVFRVDAKGNLVEYASGIRNPVGIGFYPGTHDLFVAANERDELGDNLPPDYFTYVKPGGFYGYPYSYSGKNPDPLWGDKRPDMVAKAITPDVLFPAHSAPTGLTFYEGASFPAEYKGDAFVSLHGSWNTSEPHGYKVVRIHMKNARVVDGGFENFLTGFWDGETKSPPRAWGRPVGLATEKDGSLLVADDVGNVVWRVAYTGK
jgi:glucose/arabinose dehydrogenase